MDKPETNAAPNAEAEPASEEKEEFKKATKTNPVACIGYCPVLFFVPYLVHPDNEDENEMNRAGRKFPGYHSSCFDRKQSADCSDSNTWGTA